MAKTAIQIKQADQVATATDELLPDEEVEITGVAMGVTVKVREQIPVGHKIAVKQIANNEEIYKYGEVIGVAIQEIKPGEWVHVHNCRGLKARRFTNNESGE